MAKSKDAHRRPVTREQGLNPKAIVPPVIRPPSPEDRRTDSKPPTDKKSKYQAFRRGFFL